jgi:hypothetical protein
VLKIKIEISDIIAVLALVFSVIPWITSLFSNRKAEKKDLASRIEGILMVSLEYPYCEDLEFTQNWEKNPLPENKEKYLRYDIYSAMVFNYLEDLCKYYKFNKKKIKEHGLDIKNWMKIHRKIWENPKEENENEQGYDEKFRMLIKEYLKQLEEEELLINIEQQEIREISQDYQEQEGISESS